MSVRVLARVWDNYPGKGSDLLAMLALADWSDDEGKCFPSVAALARKMRLQDRQAQRTLHGLIDQGYLFVTDNDSGGAPGMTRRYRINIERLTGVLDDTRKRVDGCHGRRETGVVDDTQTVIEPSIEKDSTHTGHRKPSKQAPEQTLAAWLKQVAEAGQKAIPDSDPVRTYAAQAGIPEDFLLLAWIEFKERYTQAAEDAKTYRDWRAVFRQAVRGNWLNLWFIAKDGSYGLTTAGRQAQQLQEASE